MKISLIATVFNEEKTVDAFLKSIFWQSRMPDEVVIVDGGSTDSTVSAISNFAFPIPNTKAKIKLIFKKGNRSVGRNEAIKRSSNEIIVCSDAGCILDKDWVKNIIKPFENPKIDVVAGYYEGNAKNVFQKCLIPYVLVMPDRIDKKNFLPSTRSMAFRKSVWEKAGGFNEKLSHNEDFAFANKLKEINSKIVFEKSATVSWIPRNNLTSAFKMFFRFALGDGESGIIRNKVILVLARYLLGFYFLLLSFIERSLVLFCVVVLGIFFYILWSIKKNYKYVNNIRALFFLPLMQFVSDLAVITGTSVGLLKGINIRKIYGVIENNKGASVIIALYVVSMLLLINWGIPNKNHPFDYFMDEWHQAQAIRTIFTQGSPNVPGSANGSMFHFLLSGILLVPFVLIGFVNPFAIKSSIESIEMQQRLFQALRLNTLFFGVASVTLIAYIAKRYFKLSTFLTTFLFVVNPIWITLSNYYKYDIALVFWIILSILFFLRYADKPTLRNYCLGAFVSGIAFSVKVSVLPLLPILFTSYFIFTKKKVGNLKHLISGIIIFILTFLIFGIPDLLIGKGNIGEYLFDNLVRTPGYSSNYVLGSNYIFYLFFRGASTIFGYFLFYLSNFSLIFMIGYLFKNNIKTNVNKKYLFIIISLLVFISSLIFLKIEARGNRLLVLLPPITLLSSIFIDKILKPTGKSLRKIAIFTLIILFTFQLTESSSWVGMKLRSNLRQSSSGWVASHIPLGSTIGIENIPIYQFLPDILLKDYYLNDRRVSKSRYNYKVLDHSFANLPSFIVVTNEEVASSYTLKSLKKSLLQDLSKQNYSKLFSSNFNFGLLSIFRSKLDYFMSGLIQEPLSISIYKK